MKNKIPGICNGKWLVSETAKRMHIILFLIFIAVVIYLKLGVPFSFATSTDEFTARFNQAAKERKVEVEIKDISVDIHYKFGLMLNVCLGDGS